MEKTIKSLIQFLELYWAATTQVKELCNEILDTYLEENESILEEHVIPPVRRNDIIWTGNHLKICNICWQHYRTYFEDQKYCSRECAGIARTRTYGK